MDTLSDPTTAGATPFYATGKRSRDLAAELGLSEPGSSGHRGPEVVRLRLDPKALVEALPALGEIMVLTRNDAAVHEKVGTFGQIRFGQETGLVLNPPIDLRLFPRHWRAAFAVETPHEAGPRRSVQIFDAAGDAVIKVHLRATSSLDAFEALRTRFAAPKAEPLDIAPYPATSATQAGDPAAFRAEFSQMRDVHEFFPLLRRHGLDRRSALGLLGQDHVRDSARWPRPGFWRTPAPRGCRSCVSWEIAAASRFIPARSRRSAPWGRGSTSSIPASTFICVRTLWRRPSPCASRRGMAS